MSAQMHDNVSFKELDQENVSDRPVPLELPKAEKYVTFDIIDPNAEPGSYSSREDPSPVIHPYDPSYDIAHMLDPNEIVIHKQKIPVVFQYPLEKEHIFLLEAPRGSSGFSRAQIALAISKVYQHIYNEEEKSSQTIATNIPGMYNRTTTLADTASGDTVLVNWFLTAYTLSRAKACTVSASRPRIFLLHINRLGGVIFHTLDRSSSHDFLANDGLDVVCHNRFLTYKC